MENINETLEPELEKRLIRESFEEGRQELGMTLDEYMKLVHTPFDDSFFDEHPEFIEK